MPRPGVPFMLRTVRGPGFPQSDICLSCFPPKEQTQCPGRAQRSGRALSQWGDSLTQAMIGIMSGLAVWLISDDRNARRQRWGWLIGLLAQPLWLYATRQNGQWGMFAFSIWYIYAWGKGVRRWWLI